jgi:methylphosphotriester-DNA--protein-cysteine methyltransferase
MARFRKIKFDTKKQALAEGYKPCRFCLAASTRTVQAKLLSQTD